MAGRGPRRRRRLCDSSVTARWDADLVRDDLRGYLADALGDPDGVLTGDDTGSEKEGHLLGRVQRQHTGTAGKIMNCQLGVFRAYADPRSRALIDQELYLPSPGRPAQSWTTCPVLDGDRDRCAAAKVPEDAAFVTEPLLRLEY